MVWAMCALIWGSCDRKSAAERIVDASIEAHGGKTFEQARISFDFRERSYEIYKSPHRYEYTRKFTDSTGRVVDFLNNEGFVRTINGEKVSLSEERKQAFTNSVNSVAYFAFLPYGLNDEAVFKEDLGKTELEGQSYFRVKVTFSEEGGGEDFEDEFIYWINEETKLVDYLAYLYHTDGGGMRFRKTTQRHRAEGLILQDYENYKPKSKDLELEDLEDLFRKGELELLSEINLENVVVSIQ